jgi:hypothetical protein
MYDLVKDLQSRVRAMADQLDTLSDAVGEWAEAPPRKRAAQAEAMAVRIEAVRDVTVSMHEEFLGLVLGP